jgi:two-component system response regulator AtoC
MANQGTMFLDEVGELPPSLQVKLLRVLQDGEIRRVGDTASFQVDVSLIAATAKDLTSEVKHGRFREDLYYRLNVLPIQLPPLRERKEDISALVEHFIELYNKKLGLRIKGTSKQAMARFLQYEWPGNVRELENIIERGMILAEKDTIGLEALPLYVQEGSLSTTVPAGLSIKKGAKEMEIKLIKEALKKTAGNRLQAARILEISHKALLYKLKEYGLAKYGKGGDS